ncbi:D-alanyl-D-alanine carboxypeptidase family protein [Reyranella sp.]|uniref:D-alanyl-D-alanine carboxypeptidase family protein n=1 Tax=Reyranella sp. TaxID=1929291 RepID=UPI00260C295C|nr:D-alanyl-D-alanine carboxypeptidase family protein [Reyranella sp.]HQS14149.1 D-alanyl-D-alanine carboxypeptidase family protein [Reyranella sp.]HQT11145.1 D-alanyl-D-alanine carboxypeptidase family protein [Reyranella sp.]
MWSLNRLNRAGLALLAVAGLAGLSLTASAQQDTPRKPPPQSQKPPAKPRAPAAAKPVSPKEAAAPKVESLPPSQVGIGTLARHAFMVDPQTSTVLLFKDAETPMPPSSMSKMMTIYIIFDELAAGRLKLDTRFRVSEKARNMGGSRMFLELGSEPTVEDLIKGIIILSGNDACVVVAEGLAGTEEAFAERMNKRAREIGMTKTVFKNASGWPAEGQYTTARDLAVLGWHTIDDYPKYYKYYAETNWTYNNIRQENRNRLLKITPGTDGLKTGHTEEGGYGQTTSAVRDGRRLILVVNGLSSMAERASETARLMEWGYRESTNITVFRAGDMLVEAPVWLGAQETVPLVIPKTVQLTVPTGQGAAPRAVARFDGPIAAPIVKGTKIGTAVVTLPDNRTIEYPLEAGADVPRMGVFSRVATMLRHYMFGWMS